MDSATPLQCRGTRLPHFLTLELTTCEHFPDWRFQEGVMIQFLGKTDHREIHSKMITELFKLLLDLLDIQNYKVDNFVLQ